VFVDGDGGGGNELGIIRVSSASDGREGAIAARLGFSEIVFVNPLEQDLSLGRVARLRIFTPATELPFAGHPSVGTAWWLAQNGTPVAVLREKAGDVHVENASDGLVWVTARPEWAPEFEWIPLPDAAQVDALEATSFTAGHHYAYAWTDQAAGCVRSRMFAPAMGIAEDEATGAAAIRLTERLDRDLRIRQGTGSELMTARTDTDDIRLGGRTVFDRTITVAL
jgi:predicted PhzF superfamily epimerase YddE/YHI9